MRVNFYLVVSLMLLVIGAVSGCATWRAERDAPAIGSFVEVDGMRAHVVDIGPRDAAKPPVVLIHGASVNLRDMKMSLGDPLSQARRVIMVDRPGRGYSERPDQGDRLDVQARFIHGVVTSLGVENPIIVGQSFGGAVALAYALQYQDEMAALVLLAPVSHEWPGGVAWYNSVSQTPIAGFLLRRLVIPAYGQLAAKQSVQASFTPDAPPENYVERAGIALLFRPRDFKSNASDIVHLKEQIIGQQNRYGEIDLTVAIVTGTTDSTVSPELHSKTLAKEISGSSLTLLPDTGHGLHHAKTAKILSIIEALGAEKDAPAATSAAD